MTGNAKTITSLGFERCLVENNVWRKTVNKTNTIRIAIYVDNLIMRFPQGLRALVDTHFLKPYSKRYNITIVGEPSNLLGIQITSDRAKHAALPLRTLYTSTRYTPSSAAIAPRRISAYSFITRASRNFTT
jgi:hypothetical protein